MFKGGSLNVDTQTNWYHHVTDIPLIDRFSHIDMIASVKDWWLLNATLERKGA